ncbi:hypothetical protein [Planctobacterium marinum]|uniref:hypothetical protein n=1 Tax=Planctobacterium marinum TaxID=1631968 RepID=UPI001E600A56|nr:hypothetical protein [Planctobacterium marinum]MCC2606582.1 hypothetical protein [Planctobacterium marinum]
MSERAEFSFRKLTNGDDGYWRVCWFGYMDYANGFGDRFSEPFIDVTMARLKDSLGSSNIWNMKRSYEPVLSKVKVPIEYLCALRLGDIWHNGSLLPEYNAHYREKVFENIEIPKDSIGPIVTSAKDKEGNFYLPFSEHSFHSHCPRINCELIDFSHNTVILIPHYVILQAYFSKCSYVFRKLFQFGMVLDEIFDPSKSHIDASGKAYVHLKTKTHDVAAAEVARIAFDPAANAAAKKVSESLALQSSQFEKQFLSPKTCFPFKAKTDLNLRGQWIKRGESLWTFLAFEILSCSAPLPFSELEYFRDNPGDKRPGKPSRGQIPNKAGTPPRKKRPNLVQEPELAPDEENNNSVEDTLFQAREGADLDDLHRVKITKQRQVEHKENNDFYTPPGDTQDITNINTGGGHSTGNTGPGIFADGGEFDSTERKNEPFLFSRKVDRLRLFYNAASLLHQHPHVLTVKLIKLNERLKSSNSARSCYPAVKISDERWSTWHQVDRHDVSTTISRKSNREAIVIRVVTPSAEYVFIEQERRITKENDKWKEENQLSGIRITNHSSNSITKWQLEALMRELVRSRGILKKDEASRYFEGSELKAFKHPVNDHIEQGTYTDAMYDKLLQLMDLN